MTDPQAFLTETADTIRSLVAKLGHMERKSVEGDIDARRVDAEIGLQWALNRDRIITSLQITGQRLEHWLDEIDSDIQTMRRRLRLNNLLPEYVAKRRELGECGSSGLGFAIHLLRQRTNSRRSTIRSSTSTISAPGENGSLRNVQLITGDSLIELRKLPRKSVQAIVTSPPFWPLKRAYGGIGLGFEPTLEQYFDALVQIFREAREVLRDDGILFVLVGDAYSKAGGHWHRDPKAPASSGLPRQDTRSIRPVGNLLNIPTRFAERMQDDGWIERAKIIILKVNAKPEPVTNRPSRNYDELFMFAKRATRYTYDPDPIRNPLASLKPGHRGDPAGSNAGSVWPIESDGYQGHPAVMPTEIVRKCLLVACPDGIATVLDCFGGAGTTALVALELGHRAISIEINEAYTREARERLLAG